MVYTPGTLSSGAWWLILSFIGKPRFVGKPRLLAIGIVLIDFYFSHSYGIHTILIFSHCIQFLKGRSQP